MKSEVVLVSAARLGSLAGIRVEVHVANLVSGLEIRSRASAGFS